MSVLSGRVHTVARGNDTLLPAIRELLTDLINTNATSFVCDEADLSPESIFKNMEDGPDWNKLKMLFVALCTGEAAEKMGTLAARIIELFYQFCTDQHLIARGK